DQLLRNHKLVDLYKVVKQGLRISESSYSLKKVENFYMEKRKTEVVSAVESVIFYEKWKLTQDPAILDSIRNYNEDDCRSTSLLHTWLLSIKPASAACFFDQPAESVEDIPPDSAITEYEQELARMRDALADNLPENREDWCPDDALFHLAGLLLDFYRRADKPAWWAIFSRMEMNEQELIDDPECIGGMTLCRPPHRDKRSLVYTYTFPDQEYKLREGQKCTQTDTGTPLSDIQQLDTQKNRVVLKIGMTRPQPPERLSIGPGKPINSGVLKKALFRFAQSLVDGSRRYRAVEQILKKAYPAFSHIPSKEKIIDTGKDLIHESIHAVANLDHSYLSIQGPPGAGKTFTAAHIILALMSSGKKIGVSSNSHKAINNLLSGIETYAHKQGITFTGIKKCSHASKDSHLNGTIIADVTSNEEAMDDAVDLVGGTAWFFADSRNDQRFDYLFVDEAGQVSLANMV
ncbi:MAG: ribonuclease H-like domain-containing protein, partial [Desulfobacteraceae bacterium]|nr:ribonuclease H-like domain-containing protein [Desulfobacteraceae bacterium]